jgi:hypothetical protein
VNDDDNPTVFQWDVYAGQSLCDSGVEPIRLILTADIVVGLHSGDSDFWAALISVIEDDIRAGQP